jgi:Ni2+-binding GTPase involved in maturation of urease and hydrogenase
MKLVICAGPATTGKTSVLRHATRKLLAAGSRVAFVKLDVQYAEEDQELASEFGIPTRKVYSGELCPDHCGVLVLGDALGWAEKQADVLLVETAGLCLRCSPYVDHGLGVVVIEATSGMNLPLKIGPMLSLADVAVVTKVDRVSQAEREVFRARVMEVAPKVVIREVNALHGIGIDPLVDRILATPDARQPMQLRGSPPVGTCTLCVGKRDVGWQAHFGVVRPLENQMFYRGE